jgi:hypothetical protein
MVSVINAPTAARSALFRVMAYRYQTLSRHGAFPNGVASLKQDFQIILSLKKRFLRFNVPAIAPEKPKDQGF